MSLAINKFALLEDHRSGTENFSSLDVLDFEHSTAAVMYEHMDFPHKDLDLARKSCYLLLTYIMGMLEVLSVIFPGRTYISRTSSDLDHQWKDMKMGVRTAWVEKQLAGWEKIEQAVGFCRDWHRLRPDLQTQAMTALQNWQMAERILCSSERSDTIEVTVVSATGLPKPNFRTPTAWANVVCYGHNQFGGLSRVLEQKTDIAQKSQNPFWSKSFQVRFSEDIIMVDIEIFDRVAGANQKLGKSRLQFSFIPGVEANFANRSLIYGYDGDLQMLII